MRNVINLVAILSCGLLVSSAFAETYYVSSFGDDTNDGLSAATAWATIQKAADSMVAGDMVLVDFGTYAETVVPKANGTAGSPIVYKALEAGEAEITSGPALFEGADLDFTLSTGAIYVMADADREITTVTEDGVPLVPRPALDSMLVAGCWHQDRATDDLYVWSSDGADPATHTDTVNVMERSFDIVEGAYITISGFTILNTLAADVFTNAIDMPGLVIEGNVFDFVDTNAVVVDIDGGSLDSVHTYSDLVFRDNVVENAGRVNIANAGRDGVICDNTFSGSGASQEGNALDDVREKAALRIWGGEGDGVVFNGQSQGLVIERNFFDEPDGWGLYLRYGVDDISIVNNIFTGCAQGVAQIRENSTNLDFINNTLFWSGDQYHVAKVYHHVGIRVYNNIIAYTRRAYTWFHDNKLDTVGIKPIEIDYNYYVSDTTMQDERDDEALRMRTALDGTYIYGPHSDIHHKIPGGAHALFGHPMVDRLSITRNDTLIYPDGSYVQDWRPLDPDDPEDVFDTVTVEPLAINVLDGTTFIRETICDMRLPRYPLFEGVEFTDADAVTGLIGAVPEDFILAEGSNLIDAALASVAPADDFFGNLRDADPDIGAIEFTIPASVKDVMDKLPENYALSQNYPNPFNPTTRITYSILEGVPVKLNIYDILGRKVRTLVNEVQTPNTYTLVWDGLDDRGSLVSGGVYFYRLQAGTSVETRKMVLLK